MQCIAFLHGVSPHQILHSETRHVGWLAEFSDNISLILCHHAIIIIVLHRYRIKPAVSSRIPCSSKCSSTPTKRASSLRLLHGGAATCWHACRGELDTFLMYRVSILSRWTSGLEGNQGRSTPGTVHGGEGFPGYTVVDKRQPWNQSAAEVYPVALASHPTWRMDIIF